MAEAAEIDTDELVELVEEFLEETLDVLGVDDAATVDVVAEAAGGVRAVVDHPDGDLAVMIGKRGQTLDAIQYLANAIAVAQLGDSPGIEIDAQGYRERRSDRLLQVAQRAASDVVRTGRAVRLQPMTSAERKVIHVHLKDHPDVETESDGVEPNRRVVILPRR
jgi:spoIIIJ-associated protein